MNVPKISIIVPIYNVEKYIHRCLDSLLNQTLKDIEIILVDDGSPDSCPQICDAFATQDERVKVIHKKNEGLGFARNSGLTVAQGKFIAFVDSDDFVKYDMFEKLYNEANQQQLDVLFCNFLRFNSKHQSKEVREVNQDFFLTTKDDIFEFLLDMIGTVPECADDRKYSMSVWHGIYSNEIFKTFNISFPSERNMISEDVIFHINYLSKCNRIGYTKECYYYYCENEGSLSSSYKKDRLEKYTILHKEILNLLGVIYPLKKAHFVERVDRLFIGYIRFLIIFYDVSLEEIRRILRDEYLHTVIERYEYERMPLKYRLMTILMCKNKVLCMFTFNRILKIMRKIR